MSVETGYKVPIGVQEFTIPRWSHTQQLQLNSIIWVLTTGQENGMPVPAGVWQAYRNQVALATLNCTSLEELVEKYLGKVQTIKNLNTLIDEILRHERRDWLASNGWDEAEIDKFYDRDGKPVEAAKETPDGATGGEGEQGGSPTQPVPATGGRTKRASSSGESPGA